MNTYVRTYIRTYVHADFIHLSELSGSAGFMLGLRQLLKLIKKPSLVLKDLIIYCNDCKTECLVKLNGRPPGILILI